MNIIIVRYKNPEIENCCIKSVEQFTNLAKHKLTIFDNAPENINLGKLWNTLIEASDEEVICLLNSDTVVEEGWTRLEESLVDPLVGAVGPVTDNCRTKQKDLVKKNIVEPIDELSGFCYLFTKRVWREVGGFPEDGPFYGQETAFNYLLKMYDYTLMVDRRVFIHHEGSSSLKKNGFDEIKERQKGAEWYKQFLQSYEIRSRSGKI